ncbi:MAG: PfkB family carbohydrate kinase [Elusimicrobia bacterium]|nr:PfkB family carbohydrate kinase [Candidatus Obscuribacterium magneticum]
MSVLVIGSVALDTIKTPFGEVREALGGSATYFSYAASFFAPVQLVAVIGSDFPQEHIKLLKDKGISVDGLEIHPGKTFRWTGLYENDMNAARTIRTELNVFETFKPNVPPHFRNTSNIFLANIDPDLQSYVLDQMKNPQLIGCDTMNHWISSKPEALNRLLKKVHILLLNDGEARQLTGITNLIKAGTDLLKRGPKAVVIKKGEHGAVLLTKDFFFVSPAYPVEDVFDPTGAGDCFAGGFFASLATKENVWEETVLRQAVIFGTLMASFNVESFSINRLKSLTQKDIVNRYQEFKKHTHFEPADHSTTFRPAPIQRV